MSTSHLPRFAQLLCLLGAVALLLTATPATAQGDDVLRDPQPGDRHPHYPEYIFFKHLGWGKFADYYSLGEFTERVPDLNPPLPDPPDGIRPGSLGGYWDQPELPERWKSYVRLSGPGFPIEDGEMVRVARGTNPDYGPQVPRIHRNFYGTLDEPQDQECVFARWCIGGHQPPISMPLPYLYHEESWEYLWMPFEACPRGQCDPDPQIHNVHWRVQLDIPEVFEARGQYLEQGIEIVGIDLMCGSGQPCPPNRGALDLTPTPAAFSGQLQFHHSDSYEACGRERDRDCAFFQTEEHTHGEFAVGDRIEGVWFSPTGGNDEFGGDVEITAADAQLYRLVHVEVPIRDSEGEVVSIGYRTARALDGPPQQVPVLVETATGEQITELPILRDVIGSIGGR